MKRSFFSRRPTMSVAIVLTMAVLGGVGAYLFSSEQPSQYSATARFVVGPSPSLLSGEPRDLVLGLDALNGPSIVATFAEVMASQSLVSGAAGDVGVDASRIGEYEFTPVEVPGAALIDLTVTGPDPRVAADLANAIGTRTSALTGSLFSIYQLQSLDQAAAPSTPARPQPTRDAALGAVLAAGLAGFVLLQTLLAPTQPPVSKTTPTGPIAVEDTGIQQDPLTEAPDDDDTVAVNDR